MLLVKMNSLTCIFNFEDLINYKKISALAKKEKKKDSFRKFVESISFCFDQSTFGINTKSLKISESELLLISQKICNLMIW